MADTPGSALGTYGEGVKWILAIAAAAIGGAFLHLKEIEQQRYIVQAILGLSLFLFVVSVWAGMYYLLWLNLLPVVRERVREYNEELSRIGPTPQGTAVARKEALEKLIEEENKKIEPSKETMPWWHRLYTWSFSGALACATLAIFVSMYSAAAAKRKEPVKTDRGNVVAQPHVTHYSLVYSAVHAVGKNRNEAHTFLMNDETGELWQMVCDNGGRVAFRKAARID